MTLSVFDIFKVGIGPSSSHTMGPMRAAREFVLGLKRDGLLAETAQVAVRLCGSLAAGMGRGTDRAVLRAWRAPPETWTRTASILPCSASARAGASASWASTRLASTNRCSCCS